MIATITLNPSIDQHFLVKELKKDDANRALEVRRFPGGKGMNVSKVARELGVPTRAYAPLAGFVGRFWSELADEIGVDYDAVRVSGETRINTIVTDVDDKTQTRISAPGPRVTEKNLDDFLKKLLMVRPKPFLWALGGSLPKGMAPRTYRRFIERLQAEGTPCILDADDEALREGVKARPFMIKPNEHEIRRLSGRNLSSLRDYRLAAEALVKRGVCVVIVSLGAKGALFANADGTFLVPGIPVPVKSKVGAGDSLIGGFAAALWKGKGFEEAARWGVAASTSAVMREAPRLCLRSDMRRLLGRARVRRLP